MGTVDADVAVLVYDLTDRGSFERMKEWIVELREKAPAEISTIELRRFFIQILGLFIVGNKSDLVTEAAIPFTEVADCCNQCNAKCHMTSAKDYKGIEELFNQISEFLVKERNISTRIEVDTSARFTLAEDTSSRKAGCCGS
jgi:GTPase SAR1 family protein